MKQDADNLSPLEQSQLTQAQIREVPCIKCDANIHDYCKNSNQTPLLTCHPERALLRSRMPAIFNEVQLDATDKALICYYGFIMIADSVAANSPKLFEGRTFSSREIQVFFAKKAIMQLKEDGLLR